MDLSAFGSLWQEFLSFCRTPPAFLSFLSADFERLLDLERSLGARLGPILRSGPSFVSSSPLIRYCLNRRFDHRFFDLFDNFIGYCLNRRFDYRFFDLFDNFIRYCLDRRFDDGFFDLFDDFIRYCLDRRFDDGFFDFFDNLFGLKTSSVLLRPFDEKFLLFRPPRVLSRLALIQLRVL